jgi:hypothetical protein
MSLITDRRKYNSLWLHVSYYVLYYLFKWDGNFMLEIINTYPSKCCFFAQNVEHALYVVSGTDFLILLNSFHKHKSQDDTILFFTNTVQTQMLTCIYAYILTAMNAHTHSLALWAPPEDWTGGLNLEIDEVSTGALLLTGTSPPTGWIFYLHETHRCQTWGLNSSGLEVQQPS